jgi:hypothetical protein
MAIVERARHLVLFDDQDRTSRKCGSGRHAERLIPHAFRAQIISTMQNPEDRLLTLLGLNCEFHLEHFLAGVAL